MQKLFKISDLKSNYFRDYECVVIPDWIFDSIIGLCDMQVEYSGYLICYKKIVQYPFISGSGAVGSVFPSKKIIFNNPDYTTIEFHTHTAALGDYWNNKFSSGDIKTFENRILQEGKKYQHVLFTKQNVITWGENVAPNIRIGFGNNEAVINIFDQNNEKYKCWQSSKN